MLAVKKHDWNSWRVLMKWKSFLHLSRYTTPFISQLRKRSSHPWCDFRFCTRVKVSFAEAKLFLHCWWLVRSNGRTLWQFLTQIIQPIIDQQFLITLLRFDLLPASLQLQACNCALKLLLLWSIIIDMAQNSRRSTTVDIEYMCQFLFLRLDNLPQTLIQSEWSSNFLCRRDYIKSKYRDICSPFCFDIEGYPFRIVCDLLVGASIFKKVL